MEFLGIYNPLVCGSTLSIHKDIAVFELSIEILNNEEMAQDDMQKGGHMYSSSSR